MDKHKSKLYNNFVAEREEVLKHKWCLSEKAGGDVGLERTLIDWVRKHRTDWKKSKNRETNKS